MITTGFQSLDQKIRGWEAGSFVVIAARPLMGKTKMMFSLITHASIVNKIPCAFFSTEKSKENAVATLVACAYNTKSYSIAKFAESPVYIDDTPSLDISDFRQKATELVDKNDVKLIFIDNLLKLYSTSQFHSRKDEMDFLCKNLKSIATELGVTIITCNHIGQTFDKIENVKPSINDISPERFNLKYVDTLILLYRPGYYRTDAVKSRSASESMEIIIAKSKYVSNGTIKFLYDDWGIHECSTFTITVCKENAPLPSPVAMKDIIESMLECHNGFNGKNS